MPSAGRLIEKDNNGKDFYLMTVYGGTVYWLKCSLWTKITCDRRASGLEQHCTITSGLRVFVVPTTSAELDVLSGSS